MKKIICFVIACLLPPVSQASEKTLASANFEDSYMSDNQSCSIKLKKTFVKIDLGYGEKLDYSVFCNEKFLHPDIKEGGTLVGCRQPYTNPKDRNPIEKVILNGKQIGWWVKTNESCGTQSYNLNALVLPDAGKNYHVKNIISNFNGVVINEQPDQTGFEVWHSRYVWCGAGATAISVPLVTYIGRSGKMTSDFSKWPASFKPTYVQAFLAGMADKNVSVLEAARELLNEKTIEKTEPCIADGVPRTKQELNEIISSMKILDERKVTAYLSSPG